MNTKFCPSCKQNKSVAQFCKDKLSLDGRGTYCKDCVKEYYKKHRNARLKKMRQYYRSLQGIFISLRGSAKQRHVHFEIKEKAFKNWYQKQKKICVYCKRKLNEVKRENKGFFKRLTIDRIDNSKGYELKNIVLCCFKCNTIKGSDLNYPTMLKIGTILRRYYRK